MQVIELNVPYQQENHSSRSVQSLPTGSNWVASAIIHDCNKLSGLLSFNPELNCRNMCFIAVDQDGIFRAFETPAVKTAPD